MRKMRVHMHRGHAKRVGYCSMEQYESWKPELIRGMGSRQDSCIDLFFSLFNDFYCNCKCTIPNKVAYMFVLHSLYKNLRDQDLVHPLANSG